MFDEPVEWIPVMHLAKHHKVTPLLRDVAGKLGSTCPPRIIAMIKQESWLAKIRNTVLFETSARLLRAFAQQGIQFAMLKGAHIAPTVYEDIGLRPMGDIDILIRLRDFIAGEARSMPLPEFLSLDRGQFLSPDSPDFLRFVSPDKFKYTKKVDRVIPVFDLISLFTPHDIYLARAARFKKDMEGVSIPADL